MHSHFVPQALLEDLKTQRAYLGDLEPLKIVDACGFGDKDRQAIVAGTASRLFNIR